jgi:hypothetical protein
MSCSAACVSTENEVIRSLYRVSDDRDEIFQFVLLRTENLKSLKEYLLQFGHANLDDISMTLSAIKMISTHVDWKSNL